MGRSMRSLVCILVVASAGILTTISAQENTTDLVAVLVLNGKGFARGTAEVTLHVSNAKEPLLVFKTVCAEGDGVPCKLEIDGNASTRVSSWEYAIPQEGTVDGWEAVLQVETLEGVSKPCFAAGTTLPAHVSCGSNPAVRFNLTGGH